MVISDFERDSRKGKDSCFGVPLGLVEFNLFILVESFLKIYFFNDVALDFLGDTPGSFLLAPVKSQDIWSSYDVVA